MKKIQFLLFLVLLSFAISCDKSTLEETSKTKTNFQSIFRANDSDKILESELVVNKAPFEKRGNHTSVAFDNKLWVVAGITNIYGDYQNDIWSSEDGVLWSKALKGKYFPSRFAHTLTVFKNKMWVIGGMDKDIITYDGEKEIFLNDYNKVWQSDNGEFWEEVTSNTPFSKRANHTAVAFKKKLWVIGGISFAQDKPTNDVWYSENGKDWIQATPNANFSPRYGHTSFVYDDKIWVIGGRESYIPGESERKNDVWYSENGIDWVQATPNAAFAPRAYHTSVVYKKRMWVLGGNWGSNTTESAWCSKDGITWEKATQQEFLKRHGHTTTVFDNKMWVINGHDGYTSKNDIWVLE
jgi:hypothetical protein